MIRRALLVAAPEDDGTAVDVVGGLPNLLRQALSLQDAGIEALTLVGISTDALRDRRLKLTVIREGAPIASGLHVDGPALVARAGCVWHPKLVRRLARQPVAPATMIAIGPAPAVLFVCGSDRIADAVAALARPAPAADGPASSTHGLAPSEFIVWPRSEATRRAATGLLLKSLEKQADGIVSRHLHRPLSRAVTRRLLPWPVTPNVMTLVAAAFGAAGVLVAVRGGYWNLLAGAILFELQNVLDGCDGEIARLKYLGSTAGEWLDQIVDDVMNIAFLAAVGAALSGGRPDHWTWQLTRLAIVSQVIHVAGLYAGLIVRAGGRGSVARLRWWVGGGTETDERSRLLGDLTRRDFYSLLYVATALLNVPVVAFAWHTAITVSAAVVTTVQWVVWNGPEYQADAEGVTARAPGRTA